MQRPELPALPWYFTSGSQASPVEKQGTYETSDLRHQSGHELLERGQQLLSSRPFTPCSQHAAWLSKAELFVHVFLNSRKTLPSTPKSSLPSAVCPTGDRSVTAGPEEVTAVREPSRPLMEPGSLEPDSSIKAPVDAPALEAISTRLDPGALGSLS